MSVKRWRKLSIPLFVVLLVAGSSFLVASPISHAAPVKATHAQVQSSTRPIEVSKSAPNKAKIDAEYTALWNAAPIQTVKTAAQANTIGFPTGTQYKRITVPGCFQPTAQEQADAVAGKLTQAQMAADDLPTLEVAGNNPSMLKTLLSKPLHAECNEYEPLTGPMANAKFGNSHQQSTSRTTIPETGYAWAGASNIATGGYWDGYIQQAEASDNWYFETADSEWTVPDVRDTAAFYVGSDEMGQWVGLGGFNDSENVFQIGTDILEAWQYSDESYEYDTWIDLTPENPHYFGNWGGDEKGGQLMYAWVNDQYQYYMEDTSDGDYIPSNTYNESYSYGDDEFECTQEAIQSIGGAWVYESNVSFHECYGVNAKVNEINLGNTSTGDPYWSEGYYNPTNSSQLLYCPANTATTHCPDQASGNPNPSNYGSYMDWSDYQ